MRSLFDHIYFVQSPCEVRDSQGNLLYKRFTARSFVIPLPSDVQAVKGGLRLLRTEDNFFRVTPPPLPRGWSFTKETGRVSRIAEIRIDQRNKTGDIRLDERVFSNPDVPEGCKIFMFFHEIGHPIYRQREELCDEFAFWHALRAGVSPMMCFLALAAYMPEGYLYRVERLKKIMLQNPWLKKYTDAS